MNRETADNLELLHPDAFGWALHCCRGDTGRAEEALQNAYLKVVSSRIRFDGRSSFKTWWFGVIRLTAMEELRRHRFRDSLLARLVASFSAEERNQSFTEAEPGEDATRLRAALKKLPSRQSETLHLVFYQDLTLSEAARVMRISVGSVRQHYERGKARLRKLLGTD